MRIHRIYTDQRLEPESRAVLTGDAAHYLTRVLRVTPGQPIVLFNGDGADYASEVAAPGRGSIALEVRSRLPARAESPLRITLVQGVSRGERMDLALQKATELGVAAIRPVFSRRSEVRLDPAKLERRMAHWRGVIIAACEQSGRACLPVLYAPVDVRVWAQQDSVVRRLVLHPQSESSLARIGQLAAVEVAVGPEGGFEAEELAALAQRGVEAVSLGPRILRTETAGPAAIAVLQAAAGDFA